MIPGTSSPTPLRAARLRRIREEAAGSGRGHHTWPPCPPSTRDRRAPAARHQCLRSTEHVSDTSNVARESEADARRSWRSAHLEAPARPAHHPSADAGADRLALGADRETAWVPTFAGMIGPPHAGLVGVAGPGGNRGMDFR